MTRQFHGVIPPLVTPLRDRDTLDDEGLQRLIEHVVGGGVHGLFLLGSTGEAVSLSYRLRRQFIQRACQLIAGRVPVLVGITDTAFVESVRLAHDAAEAGADAVVLSTPYYFPVGQTELTTYVEHLTAELPLPLVLYNMPSLTKVWFELETLKKLATLERIVGIKDSSGDRTYFSSLMSLHAVRPDWSITIGTEAMLAEGVALGGDGGVTGGANAFPTLFVECYRAAVARDGERVRKLNTLIGELQRIYEIGKYASRFIKAIKCSLSLMDVCSDFMAEPFHHFHPPERARVQAILDAIQPKIANLRLSR